MQQRLLNVSLLWKQLSAIITLCVLVNQVHAQCTITRLEQVPNLAIDSKNYFKGLLRKLPADYSTNPTQKYPLIVSFAGLSSNGNGGPVSQSGGLCNLLSETATSLVSKVESGEVGTAFAGQTPYIFIFPQFREYQGGDSVYRADQVEALLNYIVANYRVDLTRIYLVGASAGANLVMDYVASNQTRAERIAGIGLASLCYKYQFVKSGNGFDVLADSGLPTWFIQCSLDNTCADSDGSGVSIADNWVNGINANSPGVTPIYERLNAEPGGTNAVTTLNYCHFFAYHDTWRSLYAPVHTNSSGQNLYQWLYTNERPSGTLPVQLKNFMARLQDGKVYLRWTTLAEADNKEFAIERAGNNQQFTQIGTVSGKGSADIENEYEYVDDKPLSDLSYYRLVQKDVNGKKTFFAAKKIMNRGSLKQLLVVAPNPFTTELSAFITLDKTQRITALLTDINGKQLSTLSATYNEGTTEINMPVSALSRGVYFLKITAEGFTQTQKVVKQ